MENRELREKIKKELEAFSEIHDEDEISTVTFDTPNLKPEIHNLIKAETAERSETMIRPLMQHAYEKRRKLNPALFRNKEFLESAYEATTCTEEDEPPPKVTTLKRKIRKYRKIEPQSADYSKILYDKKTGQIMNVEMTFLSLAHKILNEN